MECIMYLSKVEGAERGGHLKSYSYLNREGNVDLRTRIQVGLRIYVLWVSK